MDSRCIAESGQYYFTLKGIGSENCGNGSGYPYILEGIIQRNLPDERMVVRYAGGIKDRDRKAFF